MKYNENLYSPQMVISTLQKRDKFHIYVHD